MSGAVDLSPAALNAFVDEQLEALRAREPLRAFDAGEYAARHHRLRAAMAAAGIDLLVLSSPEAMCWLHGYQSRWYKTQATTGWPPVQCTLVRADDDRLVHVDSLEHQHLLRARSIVEDVRLFADERLEPAVGFLRGVVDDLGWARGGARVGLELWDSTPNRFVSTAIETALRGAGAGDVIDATRLVRGARRAKSAAELAVIEQAARVCDAGLLGLRDAMAPGLTELEGWAAMVTAMAAAGGEPAAIHELVHFGPVQMGHEISSRRELAVGDYVFADPCGVVHRYHANVCLPLVLGEPDPRAVRLAEIQGGAYDVLSSVARVGASVRDVNFALRAYYEDAGLWSGGHAWTGGYELGIAFPPDWVGEWLFTVDDEEPDAVIEAGLVTNFESCVGFGMIDTVVFEEAGTRTLSELPHALLVAPTT